MANKRITRYQSRKPSGSLQHKTKSRRREREKVDRSRKKRIFEAKIPQNSRFRAILVGLFLLLATLALAYRLYILQIVQSGDLTRLAREQQQTILRPYIPRREIVDARSNVIATDRLVYTIYAHPKMFASSKETIAEKLSEILGKPTAKDLLERFNKRQSGVKIAEGIGEDKATAIERLNFSGIDLERKYKRFYPYQDLSADVVGYLDRDRQPQAGIEMSQAKILDRPLENYKIRHAFVPVNGEEGVEELYMPADLLDSSIKTDNLKVKLTLNLKVQQAAREALQQKVKEFKAKRGTAIVMDVRDGSIVALVNDPTYNPNEFSQYPVGLFKNWSVSDLYEPGSTFKPINVAIALDAGAIQPNTKFSDSGSIEVDGWTIANHDFHTSGGNGVVDATKILEVSSNVGMVQIVNRMKRKDYYDRLQSLEIQQPLAVDLPGAVAGTLKPRESFLNNSIDAATTSFGQGMSISPLKLVQLHAAIANGGKLVTPHIVAGLVDSQGKSHWQPVLNKKQVFSSKTSKIVQEMLESVVIRGSGTKAQVLGYRVGGKTGTAQKAGPTGGYIPNAKITSFIGMFPIESPRYVILAVIDEPKVSGAFGSTTGAPVVKSIIDALIVAEGISPSDPQAILNPKKQELQERLE
jgi:cell division protein FtsI (penicillin-binding protein 3)